MGEEVKLFNKWSSPYGQRIIWALKLKGVEFELIEEDLTNKSVALLEYNPVHKKVPVLLHNGKPIAESLVILEYIDETWKNNPLMPQDPHQRALARFWSNFGDEKVSPSFWGGFTKQGKEQEEAYAIAIKNLKYLEEELKGKKLFGGDEMGFVDIALGWLAYLSSVTEEVTSHKLIDPQNLPLLSAWTHNFCDIPVIRENLPTRDKLISRFQDVLRAVALSNEAQLQNSK